jgi:hypothetical protein
MLRRRRVRAAAEDARQPEGHGCKQGEGRGGSGQELDGADRLFEGGAFAAGGAWKRAEEQARLAHGSNTGGGEGLRVVGFAGGDCRQQAAQCVEHLGSSRGRSRARA